MVRLFVFVQNYSSRSERRPPVHGSLTGAENYTEMTDPKGINKAVVAAVFLPRDRNRKCLAI